MNRSEQEIVRLSSLDKLRELGIDPYPAHEFVVTHRSSDFADDFKEGVEVSMAGRLMSRRIMGKASFAELKDSEGNFQMYINRDEVCEGEDKTLYSSVFKKLLDRGDFVGIKGTTFLTKVGEPSVKVKELKVLSKSIRPLPAVKTDEDGNVHVVDDDVEDDADHEDSVADRDVNDNERDCDDDDDAITTSGSQRVDGTGPRWAAVGAASSAMVA